MNVSPKLIGNFIIVLGMLVLLYLFISALKKRADNKQFGRAEATVEKIRELPKNGDKDKKVKCPVVSFKAGEDEIKTGLYEYACDEDKTCKLSEGDSVRIVYERKRPDRIFPETEVKFKKAQIIFGSISGVLLIAAGAVIRNIDFYK